MTCRLLKLFYLHLSRIFAIHVFWAFCTLPKYYCPAPFLTRECVCNLLVQLLLGLARATTLGSKSRRNQTIFYCLIWDFLHLESHVPIFISLRNMVAQLYLWALGSLFIASYDSQGLRWRYSNPPPPDTVTECLVSQLSHPTLAPFLCPPVRYLSARRTPPRCSP
jgi:hypothetical protein